LFTRIRRAHYLFAARVGRRPVLVIGLAGTGTAFALVALAGSFATLIPAVLLYGLSVSLVDLGANTVGSAYEQAYAVQARTGLHAWFSAGALAGAFGSAAALGAGVGYRVVYLALAVVMAAGLLTALLADIPAPPATAPGRLPPRRAGRAVWRIPAVLFAIALISVTFFGDGALESFLSTYLQRTLAGGVLLSGIGIGSYHCASLLGRLTATAALRRYGERHGRGLRRVHPQPAHHRADRPGHEPAAGAGAAGPDQPGHRGPGDQVAAAGGRRARKRGSPARGRLAGRGVGGRVLQEAPEPLDVGPFGILRPDRDPHRPHAV